MSFQKVFSGYEVDISISLMHIESLFPSEDGFLIDDSQSCQGENSGQISRIWIVGDDETGQELLTPATEVLLEYDSVFAVHFEKKISLPMIVLVERASNDSVKFELNLLNQHTLNFDRRNPY